MTPKALSREIKFRTWGLVSDNKLGMYYFDIKNVPNLPKEDIIMQSTNLHDKNGKEIYESDILANDLGLKVEVLFLI